MQHATIFLESKARAHIAYSHFIAPDDTTKTVILFVNGLMLPRSGWEPTIANIIERYRCEDKSCPTLLSYDRYGQGSSDPDPSDEGKPDGQTHDAADAARDMHDLLNQVSKQHLSGKMPPQDPIELILVCNSIGVPIARLFAQYYPGTVSGMIFLDSNMTNTDFVSIWPDPDASDFDESSLPEGVTPEELRKVRNIYRQIFHPSVPNKERLNRTTLSELLPRPDEPKLRGFGGEAPLITVVGHDWDVFAKENKKTFNTPEPLIRNYIDPFWHSYNEGLATLTSADRSRGPIIAKGCSHFIQRDDPEFVAKEVCDMLTRMERLSEERFVR